MITRFELSNCKEYKDKQKQILKMEEEIKEIFIEYLNYKYMEDKTGYKIKIGQEIFDLMQTCVTYLNNNYTDEEILQLENNHNFKLKRRLDK